MKNLNTLSVTAITLALMPGLISCTSAENSSTQTTSDKLREYSYTVSGKVAIPMQEEALQVAFLFDRAREALDYPEDTSLTEEYNELVSSEAGFWDAFDRAHQKALPLKHDDGKIDVSKVQYWISRQIKFTKQQSKSKHVSLTLKSIKDLRVLPESNKESLIVAYTAEILGVADIFDRDGPLDKSPVPPGFQFYVPENPVQSYFEAMGEEFKSHQAFLVGEIKKGNLANALKNGGHSQLLEQTTNNTNGSKCYSPDGDRLSPFNFFYYYDPSSEGCSESTKVASLTVDAAFENVVETTYPEFHRLFEDKKVDLFVYYGAVSGEEIEASKALIARLEGRGYKTTFKNEAADHFKLTRDVRGIQMNVDISVGRQGKMPFQESIRSHEVVVYDGHAGYGANIDRNFTNESSLPENKYQIFFLNGCATYKYGMSQILDAKALKDFDFHNHNIDVVSTHNDVRGHLQNDVMIDKIEDAIPYFINGKWDDAGKAEFERNFSWLSVVTKINEISDQSGEDNGIFMVSGELGNDYEPGKTEYSGKPELSAAQLKEMILDPLKRVQVRITALKAHLRLIVSDDRLSSVEDVISKSREVCLTGREEAATVMVELFSLPGCHLKSLNIARDLPFDDVLIDHTHPIRFYDNGSLESFTPKAVSTIDGYQVAPSEIVRHRNGRLRSFIAQDGFVDPDTGVEVTKETEVVFHPNGRLHRVFLANPLETQNTVFNGTLADHTQQVRFYVNGSLESFKPKAVSTIDGYQIAPSKVALHENGRLKRFIAQDGFTDPETGAEVAKKTEVVLHPNGGLYHASLAQPFETQNTVFTGHINFYEGGMVENGEGYYKSSLRGFRLDDSAERAGFISFFENGSVRQLNGVLLGNSPDVAFNGSGMVEFHPNGGIQEIKLFAPIDSELEDTSFSFQGVKYRSITLREDGSRGRAAFGEIVELDSPFPCQVMTPRAEIYWDQDGNVVGCHVGPGFVIDGEPISSGDLVIKLPGASTLYSWQTYGHRFRLIMHQFLQEIGLGFVQ